MSEKAVRKLQEARFKLGLGKYGTFDPATNSRDLMLEALAELVDALNYLQMAREARQPIPDGLERDLRALTVSLYDWLVKRGKDYETISS
jgi:hypothetical protein